MKTNILVSVMSLIAMLGLGVQPGLADPEGGYSHGSSSEHGCCGEMMGHQAHSGCCKEMMGHQADSSCCEHMMGHRAHPANHLRHLLQHHKEIGLTEDQVKKLKAIELDFDRARITSEAEIHIAERELLALVEDEKSNLSAIEAKVKQSGMLEVGLRMSAFKARHDAIGVLTPEQREKGKAAHEKKKHGMMSGQHGGSHSAGH
jgi:protein CpxP